MLGAILKATNSSFQKGITFCRSIYVKKVMKLLAFIFEQPSYTLQSVNNDGADQTEWIYAAGWSKSLLFSCNNVRFSRFEA